MATDTKRTAEIIQRKKEIEEEVKTLADLNVLESRSKELDDLNAEYDTLQKKADILERAASAPAGTAHKADKVAYREQRAKDLISNRSVTLESKTVVMPKHVSSDIKPTFNQISSIIDLVDTKYFPNGESYTQSFLKNISEAGVTAEGKPYTDVAPEFDYVDIVKANVTAYAENSKQVSVLPLADYDKEIMDSVTKSLRMYISREIIRGSGGVNKLTGIFNAPEKIIPKESDISIEAIDEDTLDKIIFAYGGEEDVEGTAALMLSKTDLMRFSLVRDKNKQKVYTIELSGNTGYINKIPFIINSACGALSKAETAADTYCMAYGNLENYQLAVFSDIKVERSTEFKFKEGIIAHRGDVYIGGNVAKWKGFVRVKKAGGAG